MVKRTKAMRTLGLVVTVALFSVTLDGCAGGLQQILGQLINLGGGATAAGGALGAGGNLGAAAPEATPATGQGAPAPAPLGAQQLPTGTPAALPASSQDQLNELTTKYGITLRGAYNDTNVANTLTYARAYPPAATQGLSFTYTAQRVQQGVLGVWQNSGATGQSEIYSDLIDVQFHEGSHQITLADQNQSTGVAIGEQTYQAAVQAGDGTSPADSCITRDYARSNSAEFKAEFFTGLRTIENGLPTQFTTSGGTFNPPENVRAIARKIWAQ